LLDGPDPPKTRRRYRRKPKPADPKNETSLDKSPLQPKSSISKKKQTPSRRKRSIHQETPEKKTEKVSSEKSNPEGGQEGPDYHPFRSSLDQQWPGSDKNLDLNVFTKGFTMSGKKINPTQKYVMSPLTINRFSPLGSPLEKFRDLRKKERSELGTEDLTPGMRNKKLRDTRSAAR
jgi:hypothetical protein